MRGSSSDRMADIQITERRLLLMVGVILLSLLHSAAGILGIRRVHSPIEAPMGHNITLPCHFYGYEASPLDLSTVAVRWTRWRSPKEERVYVFNGGDQTQTRPGSHIPKSELMVGDGSLYIPNIQPSDEGEYTCTVIVTPDKATRTVTLEVTAAPTCTVSDPRLEMHPDTERSVTCYISGFYPEPVTIYWMKNKVKQDNWTYTSIPVQNHNGSYNIKSLLFVRPMSLEEDGDVYSCVITHRSLRNNVTCNVTLSVQPIAEKTYRNGKLSEISGAMLLPLLLMSLFPIYRRYIKKAPPEIMDITGPELIHGKKTILTCPIVNYSPRDIEIFLYLMKNDAETVIDSWSTRTRERNKAPLLHRPLMLDPVISSSINSAFSCACYIHITPDKHEHDGAKLILEVHHKALKSPLRKDVTLRVTAPPEVMDITEPKLIHRKKTTLTCPIKNFRPKNIEIFLYLTKVNEKTLVDTWLTDRTERDEEVTSLNCPVMLELVISPPVNGVFSCTCSIHITPDVQEHDGAKLVLSIGHEALESPIHKEVTLRVTAPPVLDPIEADQESYNVGDHVELSCRIHSFHPRYINVIWYKEEEPLPSITSEAEEDRNRLFSITSCVRVTVIEEDYGKIFRCTVEHPGTMGIDKHVTWELQKQGEKSKIDRRNQLFPR